MIYAIYNKKVRTGEKVENWSSKQKYVITKHHYKYLFLFGIINVNIKKSGLADKKL